MPLDPRTQKLAKILVDYSLKVKKGENVVIAGSSEASDFIVALFREIILKGAYPTTKIDLPGLTPFYYQNATADQIKNFPKIYNYTVKNAQKYIGINTSFNTRELSNCDPKKIAERQKILRPITDYIVNAKDKIRRCTVGYPCAAFAQEAEIGRAHV